MKIDQYYRSIAGLHLNASIIAIFPAILIIVGNLSFFHFQQIMTLTIPFILFSLISFQIYLMKIKQAIMMEKNLIQSKRFYHSLFEAENIIVLFMNTISPRLMLFFPNGYLAAVIKKQCKKEKRKLGNSKIFVLYSYNDELIGSYLVKGNKQMMIEVYDKNSDFVGSFERTKLADTKKGKKELINAEGRFIGAVEGASFYMDEQVIDPYNHLIGRLRRGWMPLEWSDCFPDPNTPVFSFSNRLPEKDKLLQLSLLINEFFIER